MGSQTLARGLEALHLITASSPGLTIQEFAEQLGVRRIVAALFRDPSYPADDDYVRRRYESSVAPGAWEAVAAARFRRPGSEPPSGPRTDLPYERIAVPTLVVEGGDDKLKPKGWAEEIAERIPGGRSTVIERAGHCPQIEQAEIVNDLLLDFLGEAGIAVRSSAPAAVGRGS